MKVFKQIEKRKRVASGFYRLFDKNEKEYSNVIVPTAAPGFTHLHVIDPSVSFAEISKVFISLSKGAAATAPFEELAKSCVYHNRDWKVPYALLIHGDFTFQPLLNAHAPKATYENVKELLLACVQHYYVHKAWPDFKAKIFCLGTVRKIGVKKQSPGIYISREGSLKVDWIEELSAKGIFDKRLIKDQHD